MRHTALRWSCCGIFCLQLLTGCVADNTTGTRPAWWVSRENSEEETEGRFARKAPPKPSLKLQLAYGKMQEQLGNHADARKSYQTVLGEDPRQVDAILGLARIDQLAGRTEDAESGFQKALRLRPNDPVTLDAMGQFLASQKRWPAAIHHLHAATVSAPDEASYRFHLGIAMVRSGDVPGALPHLERTVGEAEAQYNIGYVLYEKGDLAGAERHFLAASMKQPSLEVAQQMLDEIRNAQNREGVLPTAGKEKPRLERSLPLPDVSSIQQASAGGRRLPGDRPAARSVANPSRPAGIGHSFPAESSNAVTPVSGGNEPPVWPGRKPSNTGDSEVPFGHSNPNLVTPAGGNTPQGFSSEPEPYRPQR